MTQRMRSRAERITHGILAELPVARAAARLLQFHPACRLPALAATVAGQFVCLRTSRASMDSSRLRDVFLRMVTIRLAWGRFLSWELSGLWRGLPKICNYCLRQLLDMIPVILHPHPFRLTIWMASRCGNCALATMKKMVKLFLRLRPLQRFALRRQPCEMRDLRLSRSSRKGSRRRASCG